MKRLALSLALITGIAVAKTTDNLLNSNPKDGFLNGAYDFPNIHNHSDNDPIIFTGNPNTVFDAQQTITIEEFNLVSINYGLEYLSQHSGYVTLKADFFDNNGGFLDNDGGTYTITSGSWQSLSNVYDNTDYINDIFSITLTIGGVSDRGGTDDIQLRNAYVTYDYSEIPLEEILVDTSLDELIMNLIEDGATVELIDELVDNTELAQDNKELIEDIEQVIVEIEDEQEEVNEEVSEEESNEESTESDNEQSDTEESNESSDSSNSNDGSSFNADTSSSVSTSSDGALEVLELVNSVTGNTFEQVGITEILDFESYTQVSMQDVIQLEENEDFYQNQAFYKDVGMTDSSIFKGYDKLKLKDGEWYGSNNQFY